MCNYLIYNRNNITLKKNDDEVALEKKADLKSIYLDCLFELIPESLQDQQLLLW
jgi:hypothetical protein